MKIARTPRGEKSIGNARSRRHLIQIFTIFLLPLLILTGAPADAAEYPKRTLRLAHFGIKAFVQSGVDQWWADEIERRSGGKIKIRIFWAGSGGKPKEILSLVGSGAVELGATPPAYYPNELPLLSAPNNLPLTFTSNKDAFTIITELPKKIPAVAAELKRNGVVPLFFHTLNGYSPLCTKPVAKMADWKGLKIRSYGPFQPVMWKSIGAVGVVIFPAEIYEGLQRGRADCGYFSADLFVALKLYEVAKYLSTANFGPNATWPIWINRKIWLNEFNDDTRSLFRNVSAEAAQRSLRLLKKAEIDGIAKMKANGVKIVKFTEMSKLRARVPDMIKVWIKQMDAQGLGREARQVADFWRKRQAELD